MRRRANWVAVLLTIVLLFTQGLVAAYACTIGNANPATTGVAPVVHPMPNCAGMDDAPPPANLCETHCLPSQPAQPLDAPTAPVAPLPALVVNVPEPLLVTSHTTSDVPPLAAGPPARLRFSRLLI